jgi:hypothetical protein
MPTEALGSAKEAHRRWESRCRAVLVVETQFFLAIGRWPKFKKCNFISISSMDETNWVFTIGARICLLR